MKKVLSIIMAILMVLSVASVSVLAASKSTGSKKSSTKTSASAKKKTAKKLGDGVYEVPFSMWHATQDKASMGNFSVEQTSKVTIQNGKITAELKPVVNTGLDLSAFGFDPSKVYVKADQGNGNYVDATINKDAKGSPVSASVPIPAQQEYTPIKLSVGIEQMGEQDARIKLDWANAKKIADVPSASNSSSNPLSSILSTIKGLFSK